MKELLENFKKYLTEASLESYDRDGMIKLYHYADRYELEKKYGTSDLESFETDPSRFGTSYFTSADKEVSEVPRTYFYVDLDDVEKIVVGGRLLYSTEVPISEVYDLKTDPEGYIKKIKHPVYGLRKGEEWTELLEYIRDETPYNGLFRGRSFDAVEWFYPIEIYKVEDTEEE